MLKYSTVKRLEVIWIFTNHFIYEWNVRKYIYDMCVWRVVKLDWHRYRIYIKIIYLIISAGFKSRQQHYTGTGENNYIYLIRSCVCINSISRLPLIIQMTQHMHYIFLSTFSFIYSELISTSLRGRPLVSATRSRALKCCQSSTLEEDKPYQKDAQGSPTWKC